MSSQPCDNKPDAVDELLDSLNTTEEKLLERLKFLEFRDEDARVLAELHAELDGYWAELSDRFHAHLNAYPALQHLLDGRLDKLKKSQAAYFSELMSGRYDKDYVRNRIAVGLVHQRIGLDPEWYLGAYCKYLVELVPTLWKIAGGDFVAFKQALSAARKIIFFDMGIALDTYFAAGKKAIAEQRRHEEDIFYRTTHDRLTGLLNHTTLERRLDELLRKANGQSASLIILHLDDFEAINASIGHAGGDQLLHEIAQRLQERVGNGALLARHDGLELTMAAMLTSAFPNEQAMCGAILSSLSEPFLIGDVALKIRCIIGGAIYPQDADNAQTLLKHAAIALRYAKEAGSGTTLFFSDEMRQRVQLEHDLYSAVSRNQLYLEYQPIVDVKTGQMNGLEALVRWQHPELGLLLPQKFIPLAEETQLIETIGDWVLEQACRDAAGWIKQEPGIRLAINVSPKQLDNPLFAGRVEKMLSHAGIPPSSLSLEIAESIALKYTPQSAVTLERLRNSGISLTLERLKNFGISLTLDDFGAGYSSLIHLKNLPVDGVKIDLGAVGKISSAGDAAIIKAVISMAHSLGVRTSGVGIETEEQCAFLRENMCDEIQGFFYCRPLPASEVEAFLVQKKALPEHLLRLHKPQRTLLLVDDEANILAALKRLFRQDGYRILTAGGGQEGLEVLEKNEVDVIVSDQRMPGMMGVEFLRLAKNICPDTVRIVLSGYTELQSVTDAVNEGAIYKFLTKPWEDQLLRQHIAEAFRHKEMADENQRLGLEIRTANQELAAANRKMEGMLQQKQEQITRNEVSLDIVREILQHISIPLLGVDENNVIAFANSASDALFADCGLLLGEDITQLVPDLSIPAEPVREEEKQTVHINGNVFIASVRPMGYLSQAHGKLISFTRCQEAP